MNEQVSIIIVNWNGLHHLQKCLPSLKEIDYHFVELILVDNGSTDGSVDFVKSMYPNAKIVQNTTNKGFAAANNDGYQVATGQYVLFLNNDTTVEKDFLSLLIAHLNAHPEIGGLQPRMMLMDDPTRYDSVGSFYTSTGFLYHYGYMQKDSAKYHRPIKLFSAKGAGMLFRKSVIDEVGLFDPEFFAYFEETDFCHRVWLAGCEIHYFPDAVIYHKGGGTSGGMNNAFIQFHSFKNRINSYLKNLSSIELYKMLPVHIILCEAAAIAFLLKRRVDLFLAINKSILWNVQHLRTTLKKRKTIQSIRKTSDAELMKELKVAPNLKYYYYLFTNQLDHYVDEFTITN